MSALTIPANVTSASNLTFTAAESVPPAPGDDLTINSGVAVDVTAGDLNLQAGDNVVLENGSQATASGAVNVTAGSGDNEGLGGIQSAGSVGGATVNMSALQDIDPGVVNATGLATIASSLGTISQNDFSVRINAASLVLTAASGIGDHINPILTQVGALEGDASTGEIHIENGLDTPETLTIGGVDPTLHGLQTHGGGRIVLVNHGTLDLRGDAEDVIQSGGDVLVTATGADADISAFGHVASIDAGGSATISAGRNIIVTQDAFRVSNGTLALSAGNNVDMENASQLSVDGGMGDLNVTAGNNLIFQSLLRGDADPLLANHGAGDINLTAGTGGAFDFGFPASAPGGGLQTAHGAINIAADRMGFGSSRDTISAAGGSGTVRLRPVTDGEAISLGTATGGLNLSNGDLEAVHAGLLVIGSNTAGAITVGGTVSPPTDNDLTLISGDDVDISSGAFLQAVGDVSILAGGSFHLGAASTVDASVTDIQIGSDRAGTADLRNGEITSSVTVTGGSFGDTFLGSVRAETFNGMGGDDTFTGGGGDDHIDGGAGTNTAVYSGNIADYTRTQNADGSWTVADNRAGSPDGTDTLIRVQTLQFADGTVSLLPSIGIGPIAGDDIINRGEAASPVAIGGTTTNVQDGQTVTVTILDAAHAAVDTLSTGVSAGVWHAALSSALAQALADGSYTVTADVADAAGTSAPEATRALTVDETLPSPALDTASVVAGHTVTVASPAQGVLANDTDPNGDPLTVTGISASLHGGGAVDSPFAGQFGSLTIHPDGTYSYVANNAATLAEGQIGHDTFAYAATDRAGNTRTATLDIQVTGHAAGVMDLETYTAVESATGDKIFGALYDDTGRYTVGSTVNDGPDDAHGSWTYTITGISQADLGHQDASYSGFVYDYDYQDAGVGTFATAYGSPGFAHGVNDKANFSGNNYLGSDGDVVVIGGHYVAIGSGHYVVPEGVTTAGAAPVMQEDAFEAVESATGDRIFGELFDDTGRYSIGSTVNTGADEAGGSWTYTVTNVSDADAAHRNAALSGFVYDFAYFDADRATTFDTFYGKQGLASGDRATFFSGNNYLGSDGDLAVVGSRFFAVASGRHVLPDPLPAAASPATLASTASDGAPAAGGMGANLALLGNMSAASFAAPGLSAAAGSLESSLIPPVPLVAAPIA